MARSQLIYVDTSETRCFGTQWFYLGGHLQEISVDGQATWTYIHCSMDSQPGKQGLEEWVTRINWSLTSDKAAWNQLDHECNKVPDGALNEGSAKCLAPLGKVNLSVLIGVIWTTGVMSKLIPKPRKRVDTRWRSDMWELNFGRWQKHGKEHQRRGSLKFTYLAIRLTRDSSS